MTTNKNLLFLTNFSEACYQAVPSVAEWMDREQGRLTILHVSDPAQRNSGECENRLKSFFAEADRYRQRERVLLSGPRVETLVKYCQAEKSDMVFAPASKPSGLPRIFHQSLRARLIRECGVKLWTRGRSEGADTSTQIPKQVVYVITGSVDWVAEAVEAAKHAACYGAQLHYVYLAPWPEVHEGLLAGDIKAQLPNITTGDVRKLAEQLPIQPKIHTRMGDSANDLARLLKECRADVAFVGEAHMIQTSLWRDQIHSELDRLDCQFFCFPSRPLHTVEEKHQAGQKFLAPAQSR